MTLRGRISLTWRFGKGAFLIGVVYNLMCAGLQTSGFSYTFMVDSFIPVFFTKTFKVNAFVVQLFMPCPKKLLTCNDMRNLPLFMMLMMPFCLSARHYEVFGPQGGVYTELSLPARFNPDTDKCHLVILMHGFGANGRVAPLSHIRRALLKEGYAVLRLDFNGYGRSEGAIVDNTVPLMLEDAMAVWKYASELPYVDGIVLLGHSQGGLVASMLAGRLQEAGTAPSALVLMAPASNIKDFAAEGRFFGISCNPLDPPASISIYGIKVGRKYILSAQALDVFGEASRYTGPVCLLQGDSDKIVPPSCSQEYHENYSNSELHIINGCGHQFLGHKREADSFFLNFLSRSL